MRKVLLACSRTAGAGPCCRVPRAELLECSKSSTPLQELSQSICCCGGCTPEPEDSCGQGFASLSSCVYDRSGCQEGVSGEVPLLQAQSCPGASCVLAALRESASQTFKQGASAVLLWAGTQRPLLRPLFAKLLSLPGMLCWQDAELGGGCGAPA